jgi:hypothetical protein
VIGALKNFTGLVPNSRNILSNNTKKILTNPGDVKLVQINIASNVIKPFQKHVKTAYAVTNAPSGIIQTVLV